MKPSLNKHQALADIHLKFTLVLLKKHTLLKFSDKQAWANSVDLDHTAPKGAV